MFLCSVFVLLSKKHPVSYIGRQDRAAMAKWRLLALAVRLARSEPATASAVPPDITTTPRTRPLAPLVLEDLGARNQTRTRSPVCQGLTGRGRKGLSVTLTTFRDLMAARGQVTLT